MNCNVKLYYSVTVLLQGQFEVETTTLFQPHFNHNLISTTFQRCINIEITTLFQPHFNLNVVSMVKSQRQSNLQIQVTTIFQPCFNVDM